MPYGPDALLLEWEQRIDPDISRGVHAYAQQMWQHPAILESVPAYCSLLLRFDASQINTYQLREWIYNQQPTAVASRGKNHKLPMVYGGEYGPDLEAVAQLAGLTEDQVINLHQKTTYQVYQLGYQPGFAFLGQTAEELSVPRLENPRGRVPAGSVGLAGRQTGIYPHAAPGGWQLVGRCPATLWDASRKNPSRLNPGDQVKFFAVEAGEWDKQKKKHATWKD